MCQNLHVLILVIIILVIVVIIVIRFVRRLLGLLLFLLLATLKLVGRFPLGRKSISLSSIISDDDVVKDGLGFHLPQVETDEAESIILVHTVIIDILRIGDSLGLPLSLVLGVVLHGGLPLTILLIIPVIRLLGIGIHNTLLLDPVSRLGILWIIHHGCVHPITRLLVIWVWDDLWLQELPVILHVSGVHFRLVNVHLDGVVGVQSQSVQVRHTPRGILLVGKIRLLQDILALVVEDQMSSLGVSALVRAKHDVVRSWVTEGGWVLNLRANLDIATTALDVLLVLGLVLDDQALAFVTEGIKIGTDSIAH